MSVMHTTIHHAAQKPHTPTQKSKHRPQKAHAQPLKGRSGSKAHSKCNMPPKFKMIFPIFQENP